MPINHLDRNLIESALLEDSVKFYSAKLTKLQRFWIPLQKQAPCLVLAMWVISVIASMFTQSYYHWVVMAPAILMLIVLEVFIEEVQIDLLLMTDETRYLLYLTRSSLSGH